MSRSRIFLNRKLKFYTYEFLQKAKQFLFANYKKLILSLTILALTVFALLLPVQRVYIEVTNSTTINTTDLNTYKNILKGQPFFLKSTNKLQEFLLKKDPRLKYVEIKKLAPGRISVKVTEKSYVAKYIYNEHYYLISEQGDIVVINKELFNKTTLPTIVDIDPNSLQLILPQLTNLLKSLENYSKQMKIQPTQIQIKIKTWEIPTISITFQNIGAKNIPAKFTAFFSPNKPVDKQVAIFITTVNGLSDKKIQYTFLDIRFDRVVIK